MSYDLMSTFNDIKQALYNHVGFTENLVVYAIEDHTDMFWFIDKKQEYVKYAENKTDFDHGDYYENEIYHQRFYNKWIYHGKRLTMIIVDTHVDGNKFFAFFDNKKEIIN